MALLLASCSRGYDDVVEREQAPCEELLEHVVDLRVATATGTTEQLEDHRAALKQALGRDFIDSCERNLSPAQQQCSIRAANSDAVLDCAKTAR